MYGILYMSTAHLQFTLTMENIIKIFNILYKGMIYQPLYFITPTVINITIDIVVMIDVMTTTALTIMMVEFISVKRVEGH